MVFLFKNAQILTMENDKIQKGNLVTKNNRIAYIGNDYDGYGPFDRIIDCQNNLLMPGFKNAHAHSGMVFLAGKADADNLQDWLFKIVFPREEKLIPSDIYHLNKLAYLEYVSGGMTACFDHYFFPLEAARSANEFGMRTLLLATHDPLKTSVEDLEKNYHFLNDVPDGLVKYIVGFHAEYTTDDALLKGTKESIDLLKSPFYTHISETKKEVEECLNRHHKTPFKFLFDEGLLNYGGGGFHCVHLTDEEVKIVKDNHLNIISCPGSNLKLKSGTAPLEKYLKEGINIALGTDGPASNDGLDMFREMRLAASNNPNIPPFEIVKMATVNAAKAMLLDNADILAVNKYADLIMIDLSKDNLSPLDNFFFNFVNKGNKDNIKLTMINGKILYEDGKFFLNESLDEIKQKVNEIQKRIENEIEK